MSLTHNFRPGELAIHYRKHSLEFGPVSQQGYLHRARAFLNRSAKGFWIQEGYRGTAWGAFAGDRVRFDITTQEFGIVTAQGYIRTYFLPDPSRHGYPSNFDYFLSHSCHNARDKEHGEIHLSSLRLSRLGGEPRPRS